MVCRIYFNILIGHILIPNSSVPKGQGGCTSLHKSDFLHADSLGIDNSEFDH